MAALRNALTVEGQLKLMVEELRAARPFFHTRWNDGEAAALDLVDHGEVNCDGHRYSPSLRQALWSVWKDLTCWGCPDVILGTITVTDPSHPAAQVLRPDLVNEGNVGHIAPGEFWCQEEKLEGAAEVRELFSLVKVSGRGVLVAPPHAMPARFCLGAEPVAIPESNAWDKRQVIFAKLLRAAQDRPDPIYLWCAGFPGKVWAWRLRELMPESTHIDVGHTFDGVFGRLSRGWMSKNTSMRLHYFTEFAPWVKGFMR